MARPYPAAGSGVSISSAFVWRSNARVAAILVAATCLHASGTPRSWREGPVRFLLTDEEREAFGALKTDEARDAFAERFWQRLDPDPTTAVNEFRETYEARVALAESRFEAIGGPAWSSDRGRVLLLLGEPQEVRRESAGLLAVEKEVWAYSTRAEGASGVASASETEIPFFRCANGAYRLDPTCPTFDRRSASTEWFRTNAVRWATIGAGSSTSARVDLEDVITSLTVGFGDLPPPHRSAVEDVDTASEKAAGPVPFSEAAYFFRAADGTVLTMFAVEVPAPAAEESAGRVLAAVTLEGRSGGGTRALMLDPAPDSDPGRVYLGRAYLPPRTSHAARYAIQEEAKAQLLVRNRRLDVPDLSGFSASSVVPAERFGPAGSDPRLVVGSEEVLPRPGGVFRNGELLRLYLQVYGASIDPRTSMPRVDVTFHFRSDAKARPRSMRRPFKITGAAGASMGLALPVGDWPEGSYHVDVDLHDRVSGARASAVGAFRIVAR
ncbi:MAG TPA: GWxTD domain-containing protein [Candidatus Polarisedimenticolaceae bacterium]|nr:GWxTD domain-containing protein [Candidatus Polarisedimenticolaceae bacterium]